MEVYISYVTQLLHGTPYRLVLGKDRRFQIQAGPEARQRDRSRIPRKTLNKGIECLSGFLVSPTPDTLDMHRDPVLSCELGLNRSPGASIGLLGIDLTSRRRNRLNGRILHASPGAMTIKVDQSYGNCPQYIQPRLLPPVQDTVTAVGRRRGSLTDPEVRRILEAADTFFIASRVAGPLDGGSAGIDASHRGGRPGFLGIHGNGTLSFPDFAGNRFFNTLGNIESDGRVGLFVPDFDTGEAIVLTGRASIDWDPGRIRLFEGAERVVDVTPDEIWHADAVLPVISTKAG